VLLKELIDVISDINWQEFFLIDEIIKFFVSGSQKWRMIFKALMQERVYFLPKF